uniref:Uncharacterized protein n=1 Tax=Kalanchoe fedtschenkoi TaxID=63787 RepID=A0A7N0VKH5_KALFE
MSSEPVDGGGEIMLFGVRVAVDCMRKSVSLNNLSQKLKELEKKVKEGKRREAMIATWIGITTETDTKGVITAITWTMIMMSSEKKAFFHTYPAVNSTFIGPVVNYRCCM